MADHQQTDAPPGGADAAPKRITAVDIQQKQFRLAFRGYHEREVDEFLDQVTEEVARLITENRRLEEEVAIQRGAPLPPATSQSLTQAHDEAGRVVAEAQSRAAMLMAEAERRAASLLDEARAVASAAPGAEAGERGAEGESLSRLIAREKEFLQRLAALIQDHMSTVKEEVRTARESVPEPAEPSAPVVPAAVAWTETVTETPEVAAPMPEEPFEPEPEPSFPAAEPAVLETTPPAWEPPSAEEASPAWAGEEASTEAPDMGVSDEVESAPSLESEPEPAAFEPELEAPMAIEAEPEPAPPPDLEPVTRWTEASEEPEPTRSWLGSDFAEDASTPEAEVVPQPADDVFETEPLAGETSEESSDLDDTPEPMAWPPVVEAQPAAPPQEDRMESYPLPTEEPAQSEESLFEQPSLTGDVVPSEPEPPQTEWSPPGMHERPDDSSGLTQEDGTEGEDDEDRSLRELFWGEEN